jgi:hypothetical protein
VYDSNVQWTERLNSASGYNLLGAFRQWLKRKNGPFFAQHHFCGAAVELQGDHRAASSLSIAAAACGMHKSTGREQGQGGVRTANMLEERKGGLLGGVG